jgi:hypothetical protein
LNEANHASQTDRQKSAHLAESGRHTLQRPLRPSKADEVRQYLAGLGITEQDVTDAIAWARESH